MMKNRITVILLSVMMVISMLPAAIYADTGERTDGHDEYGETINAIAAELQDPANDPFSYETSAAGSRGSGTGDVDAPAQFDLRDVDGQSYVTPVKFQNPFGTCWGFAAIAAAESSILGSGLAAKEGLDADTLDLSEKHLTYFLSQAISDPSNPQYGEGTHADPDQTLSDLLNGGGLPFLATSLFASGVGPNLESRDSILGYHGKNYLVDRREVDGKIIKYCYDDADDWSIPEDWRFKQTYTLKESFMLPSPAQVDSETYEYTYNPAGTAAIKDMLLHNRAVEIGFCADTSFPSQESGDGQYISTHWAHYTYDDGTSANHAVTIIGWDDNYPAENFVTGHEPMDEEGNLLNGAWLVKNSWGSSEREFPNKGPGWGIENEDGVNTGYFWLSYYDKSISMPEALDFDRRNDEMIAYSVDQHDFMPVNEITGVDLDQEMHMANVFEAKMCECLDRVSCETTYPGTTVVSEVYLLSDDFSGPTDGKLVSKTEGTFEYGGFHMMDLSTPVMIRKGQHYSIVQTHKTAEDQYAINLSLAFSEAMIRFLDGNRWVHGVINEKESYLYSDGKWYDFSGEDIKQKLFGDQIYLLYEFDNFPIKGYSSPRPNINMRVTGNTPLGLSEEDNSTDLRLSYIADEGIDLDTPRVTWELDDAGSDYFTVTADPLNQTRATVTADKNKVGSAYLYVTAEDIGTAVIRLSVKKYTITCIGILGSDCVYNVKPHKPALEVETSDGKILPSSHYTVKYEHNVKCGSAWAIATINPDDPEYEGDSYGYFSILPARAKIKKVTEGTRKLTVNVKSQKASGVSHYQVRYRIKGGKTWKSKTFKASSGTKLVIKGLQTGKRYQVKVRAYLKDDSGTYEGKYSKVKTTGKIK